MYTPFYKFIKALNPFFDKYKLLNDKKNLKIFFKFNKNLAGFGLSEIYMINALTLC